MSRAPRKSGDSVAFSLLPSPFSLLRSALNYNPMTEPVQPPLKIFVRIRQLLEMIRFSHTLFALPFALLSAVMAWAIAAIIVTLVLALNIGARLIATLSLLLLLCFGLTLAWLELFARKASELRRDD